MTHRAPSNWWGGGRPKPPKKSDPDAPQPRRLEYSDVASAQVAGRPSVGDKVLETFAIVLGPLLIPAILLGLIRAEQGDISFFSGITVGDMAFGFVAVSFAAIARSLSGKGTGQKPIGISAMIVVVFEVSFAISHDTFAEGDQLLREASRCTGQCDVAALASVAGNMSAAAPGIITWSVVLALGSAFGLAVLVAIWVES